MEGIHTVKNLLQQGDQLAKVDLKDAFFSTNRPPTQKVSQVYLQREDLPVQLCTIWAVLSSVGVHQNPETSSSRSKGEV